MYFGDIKYFDVANGPGIRTTLFVSGCRHHCKGCFNPETWNFSYGKEFNKEVENQILDSLKFEYVKGLTLLGGEPMEKENQEGLYHLIKRVHETYPNKSIWCFTGYLFEDLLKRGKQHFEHTDEILKCLDVIVDGEFQIENKDLRLMFKGSSNQRTIDVQESLKQNKIVLRELVR